MLCAAASSCRDLRPELAAREFAALRQEFIDTFLMENPTLATQLGLHEHDEKLADLSEAAIQAGADRFQALLDRLMRIDPKLLEPSDQSDYEILKARMHAELLERREIRTHTSNPMLYPLEISSGLASLSTRPFAPTEKRMRAAIARLLAVPGVLQAARENLQRPPELFTRLALELSDSVEEILSYEYSGEFGPVNDMDLRADFESSRAEAAAAMRAFEDWLDSDLMLRSDGHFALGISRFSRKLLYEELLDIPVHRLLSIGESELRRQRVEFVDLASKFMPGAAPREVITALSRDHPPRQEVKAVAEEWMQRAYRFMDEHPVLSLPRGPEPAVRETPVFLRYAFASMNAAGPFERAGAESYYYLTPPADGWPAGRVEAYLSELNRWVLGIVTLHETYPGHYVQALIQRQDGPMLRRVVPVLSYSEGWAHYCEQMMLEQGFEGSDPRLRLAQLKDSLLRLCRLVAAVRLHTLGMTLREATHLFVEEAFMTPQAAQQEAERGAYDPMVLVYAMGKMQIVKLREDVRARQAEHFSLRAFHDRLLGEGEIPLSLLRRRMLPDDTGPSL